MMSGHLGKTTNWSRDVTGAQVQAEREEMWGPINGEVVSYDEKSGTATVKPLYRPIHNGKPIDMPDMYEVPIEFPRSGISAITFPVPPGTKVRLTPMMRSDELYDADGKGEPSDRRSFHPADMKASLIGGDSLAAPLEGVDPDNTHLRFSADGRFGIRGSPDGKFKIEGAEGNLYDIFATFMELVASDQLKINHGSSSGSGHELQNRAELMALAAKVRAMAL